jgi:hypothetical protein
MTRTVLILATFLFGTFALADEPQTPQEQVARRQASIAKMKPEERAEAYAKLALDLAELASVQLQAGDGKAEETLLSIGEAANRSLEAARMKRKKIKQAEIALRQTSRRLEEIRRSQSILEQAPFKEPVAQVENAQNKMLELLFKK